LVEILMMKGAKLPLFLQSLTVMEKEEATTAQERNPRGLLAEDLTVMMTSGALRTGQMEEG